MLKTSVSVAAVGHAPEIVKNMIDRNGWPICTIVVETGRVNFYFYYKWYQYYKVHAFEKAVKDCEERYKYYCKPNIYGNFLSEAEMQYVRADEEATARFVHEALRRDSKDRNLEAIVDKNGCLIGCKISLYNCLRRGSK